MDWVGWILLLILFIFGYPFLAAKLVAGSRDSYLTCRC